MVWSQSSVVRLFSETNLPHNFKPPPRINREWRFYIMDRNKEEEGLKKVLRQIGWNEEFEREELRKEKEALRAKTRALYASGKWADSSDED
ncbi:uncharacterized protein L201_003079 [Kwoniella dendrophila CBS 6074]|uniref:Uncharacterized protein n=1 Tax=Kwoniella dendrophila CBS 6074 TaxID=1295534 RepID=A0AAX4JTD6_9TREE